MWANCYIPRAWRVQICFHFHLLKTRGDAKKKKETALSVAEIIQSWNILLCVWYFLRCVCQESIFVRGSVHLSVSQSVHRSICPSLTPVQKPCFLAVFGPNAILNWIKWLTNTFWEYPLLLDCFIFLFVTPYMILITS